MCWLGIGGNLVGVFLKKTVQGAKVHTPPPHFGPDLDLIILPPWLICMYNWYLNVKHLKIQTWIQACSSSEPKDFCYIFWHLQARIVTVQIYSYKKGMKAMVCYNIILIHHQAWWMLLSVLRLVSGTANSADVIWMLLSLTERDTFVCAGRCCIADFMCWVSGPNGWAFKQLNTATWAKQITTECYQEHEEIIAGGQEVTDNKSLFIFALTQSF